MNSSSSIFIFQQVKAYEAMILSPQDKVYTANTNISLTFTVDEFASWIGYSLNGQTNITIEGNATLPALADGRHYVIIYGNDTRGNMEASSPRHFIVDTIAPTGSIKINSGASATIAAQVTLSLSAEDDTSGVAQMRFFEAAWGDWEDFATSKIWEFKASGGYMTVYVQFRDNAGLVSASYPATIYLGEITPPSDPPIPRAPSIETKKETPEESSRNPPATIIPEETMPIPKKKSPSLFTTDKYSVPALIGLFSAIGILLFLLLKKRTRHQTAEHRLSAFSERVNWKETWTERALQNFNLTVSAIRHFSSFSFNWSQSPSKP